MARRKRITPEPLPIDSMADSFRLDLQARSRSENTIDGYLLSVRLFLEFLKSNGQPLTIDVSRDDVRAFIVDQSERNSPSTALVRFKGLQQFFAFCVREGELELSPMDKMAAPSVKPKDPPVVGDDVLTKLLKVRSGKTFGDLRDTAVLRLFIDTGARRGEVTNLRQGDFDKMHRTITVTGKTGMRTVAVGNKAVLALDRYLRALARQYPERIDPELPLWYGRAGRMSTSGVSDVLHRMCADAGVERLHWHQLRHTWAHVAMAAGAPEGDIMVQAGWSSRSMLDVYARQLKVQRAHDTARKLGLGDRV